MSGLEEKYIIVDACAYCYGPAGSMDSIISAVNTKYQIILLGTGSALELLGKNKRITKIYEVDTENYFALEKYKALISNAKLVLCNTNPVMASFAKYCGCVVFYIDILPWMNSTITEKCHGIIELYNNGEFVEKNNMNLDGCLSDVDMYYLQSYFVKFDVDSKIKNYKLIAPLVPKDIYDENNFERKNNLIISTGGLINPDIEENDDTLCEFVRLLVKCSMKYADLNNLEHVYLCGPEVLKEINTNNYNGRLTVNSYGHNEFLKLVNSSKYIAFVPGLTTMYEAFLMKVKSLLLPPTNCSQVLQLDAIEKSNLSGKLICWNVDSMIVDYCLKTTEVETAKKICELLKDWIKSGVLEEMLLNGFDNLFSDVGGEVTEMRYEAVINMGQDAIKFIVDDINVFLE